MIYQPMTDSEAEDIWVDAFMLLMETRDPDAELVLFGYMYHVKRSYPGIMPKWAHV